MKIRWLAVNTHMWSPWYDWDSAAVKNDFLKLEVKAVEIQEEMTREEFEKRVGK